MRRNALREYGQLGLGVEKDSTQRGFALLTVMLIVALVAILSGQLIYQQHLTLNRSANMLHQAQSLAVAWGLEGWVKQGLQLDVKNNQVDHLQEMWAQPMLSVPFEGGEISGQLYDLQGRLNLNNVQESDQAKREVWQAVIDRWALLVGFEVPLAEVLTDWVDADNERLPGGAESDAYLLMQPPYRAANQSLVMLEELKNLQGLQKIEYDVWRRVKDTATALPTVTAMNVNTAQKEGLMALADWMNEGLAEAWILQRKESPAESVEAFRVFVGQQTGMEMDELNEALPDWLLSVNSDYFLLVGQVNYGESLQGLSAIFYRQDQSQVKLVQRWLSVAETP
ncbi:MAG: type II secretion system minor pseudopilin GspK [Thiomicrorhabdus chilensis]|uniref:type II secretion system minor pseudopilin GspK n=1 Tax=Thiomicrorhabdus chilensis TaxID=63656 RepID=UPI00299D0657|nr:type II secretion system minor pseudopilin GspK [Thiomicrorhabdus chilensis]MDX1347650.1 type II secretion system minor pseudopilin GspK [Thiomicrorhabdus chilensis]